MVALDRTSFLESLRDALNHLYEAEHLRHNSLAITFGVADRLDTSSQLRNILVNAIETLKPDSANPANERGWRMYDALFYCYVQRLSQQAVADQISLSTRHLRREQKAALELLADTLCQQYGLHSQVCNDAEILTVESRFVQEPANQIMPPNYTPGTAFADLEWLRTAAPHQPMDLKAELQAALTLVEPLSLNCGVMLQVHYPDDLLMPLAVNPQAFQQIMLNLLGMLIPASPGGAVQIHISQELNALRLDIQTRITDEPSVFNPDELEIIQYMVTLCKGSLDIVFEKTAFAARLYLPFIDQVTVLAVDDNPDTLQLFERYTAGTRYRMVGLRDPQQAQALASQVAPRVILLDVMMPGMDGWKILGRLRQHPKTQSIAVIVCTIFPQEKLALSLGASGFLKKPVSRQSLLDLLDRQVGLAN